MDDFSYKARKRDGTVVTGVVTAPDEAAVAAFLRRQNLYVAGISKSTKVSKQIENFFEKGIGVYDIAIFCRQFATLLSAGVPLLNGIEILSNQAEKLKFRAILSDMATKIREGRALSSVMEDYPKVFPDLLVNMVAAGETGGILETVMERMATQLEKDYRMNQKFKNAMVYPAIVIGVASLSVAIIMKFVMPIFVGLFESLNMELPAITRFIIALSNIVGGYWYVLIALAAIVAVAYKRAMTRYRFRLAQDELFIKVPVFGDLYKKIIKI